MRKATKLLSALFLILALAIPAFAANSTPVYSLALPATISRGDIFNATVSIKSTAVTGVDYSASAPEYKFTGAMVKITFPAEDLEIVNTVQLASAFDTSGLSIQDYKVVNGTLTFMVDKKTAGTTLTPLSIPVAAATQFVTLTFKANRNSAGSDASGATCDVVIPAADNTVIYQTGYTSPASDATGTVSIKSDTDTPSDPTGDPTKRAITAKINLEYPGSGGSHASTLSALYWQEGDTAYTSFPGVQSAADGAVSCEFARTADKKFRVGFKRASSLVLGAEKTDAKTADFSTTVFKLVEGDLNSDNVINGTDYTLLTQLINYAPQSIVGINMTGDVNNDGKVDKMDIFSFNNLINGTEVSRYLKEGFDMTAAGTPTNPLSAAAFGSDISSETVNGRAYTAPKNSIINVKALEEKGKYGISFSEATPNINMLQIALDATVTGDVLFDLPEGWEVVGQSRTAYGVTFAIGTETAGGRSIAPNKVFATISSSSVPSVIYSGKSPSTMELATETSVVSYGFDAISNASDGATKSGSNGGCNAGIGGVFTLLTAVILTAAKKRGK